MTQPPPRRSTCRSGNEWRARRANSRSACASVRACPCHACPVRPIRTPRRISRPSCACCRSPGRSSTAPVRSRSASRSGWGCPALAAADDRRRGARARDRGVPRGRAGRCRRWLRRRAYGRAASSRSCATAASAPMAASRSCFRSSCASRLLAALAERSGAGVAALALVASGACRARWASCRSGRCPMHGRTENQRRWAARPTARCAVAALLALGIGLLLLVPSQGVPRTVLAIGLAALAAWPSAGCPPA